MKVQRLFDEHFHLIPIRKNSKLPVYRKWQHTPLPDKESTLRWLRSDYNIAVVAGEQSQNDKGPLLVLDFDDNVRDPELLRKWETLVALTPHGHHVYFRGYPKSLDKRVRLQCQTLRYTAQYALIPPSKVDGHSYWWLDNGNQEIRVL